jgi:hypothetical protein
VPPFVDAACRPLTDLNLKSLIVEGDEACQCDGVPAAWTRETIHGTPSYQRSRRVPGNRHLSIVGGDQDGDELDS